MGYHIVTRNPNTGEEFNPASSMGCLAGFRSIYDRVKECHHDEFNERPDDLFFRVNTNPLSQLIWDKLVSEDDVLDAGLGDRSSSYDYIKIPRLPSGNADLNTMHFYLNPYRLAVETSRAAGITPCSLRNKKHIDVKTTWFSRHFVENGISGSTVVPGWHQSCYSRIHPENTGVRLHASVSKGKISAVLNADKYWRKRFPITGELNGYRVAERHSAWGNRSTRGVVTTGTLNTVTRYRRLQSLYSVMIACATQGIDADITKYGWEWR